MAELSETERMFLAAIRKDQAVRLASGHPAVEMIAKNTLFLLDIIERLEPGATTGPDWVELAKQARQSRP